MGTGVSRRRRGRKKPRKSGVAHNFELGSGTCLLGKRVWDEWEGSRQAAVPPLGSQRSDKADPEHFVLPWSHTAGVEGSSLWF